MALADIITCPILGMMTQFDQPKWHLLERYVSLMYVYKIYLMPLLILCRSESL